MPAGIIEQVKKSAAKKGFTGKRADRYVYGAMNNKGYMRGNQETKAGQKAEKKFNRDHPGWQKELES